jgi:hypothetical protein
MRSQSSVKLGIAILATLTFFSIANADSSLPPSSTVFVRIRGNAADFVLKKLSAVATTNGLACNIQLGSDPPALLCQFDQLLYNAVITTTDDQEGLVRVDMFYWDESLNIDKQREAQMSVVVRQFAKALKRTRHVEAIQQCDKPVRVNLTKGVCDGQSLW